MAKIQHILTYAWICLVINSFGLKRTPWSTFTWSAAMDPNHLWPSFISTVQSKLTTSTPVKKSRFSKPQDSLSWRIKRDLDIPPWQNPQFVWNKAGQFHQIHSAKLRCLVIRNLDCLSPVVCFRYRICRSMWNIQSIWQWQGLEWNQTI